MITNVKFENDGKTISWEYQGLPITKSYDFNAYFVVSKKNDYIVVVEPDNSFSPDNAVIFNPDGSEKKRITNPCRDKGAICFGDIYYVLDNITLISICNAAYYACKMNNDGDIVKIYETR